ncbi:uncharacterized protein LOC132723687 [Ruditapes philippinarum]|uniref:uncharacterized protein LOC132723687 n=1 Tax=Ruditapes philippinarum TaxID=129788 RepID=UPI00295B5035|nr:uncharacterized protein LOC132723687 [Ruditapes philippinarum]
MEDDIEIVNKLGQYPSSFDLYEDVQSMSKDCLKKHLERLIKEVASNPYDNTMEKLRAWNFISFLSFILGNEKDAFEYNSKVLERSKENIMGLCNKARFLLKMQEKYHVVNDLCKQLDESIKHKGNMLFAKAEKAFHYLCFGTERNKKSRHLFEEVLGEIHKQNIDVSGDTDDSENTLMQTDNYCVLNFSYALTYKRALNFTKTHDVSSFDVTTQLDIIKKVCNIYSRIIHIEGGSTCLKLYKGRSCVELGSIDYYIGKNKSGFQNVNGIKDFLPGREDLWLSTNEFYEKAECFCPNDVFVLERCGSYFRYVNDIDKSISLLEKAITIRETSYSHHHLALSLKRQVESHFRQPMSKKYFIPTTKPSNDRNKAHFGIKCSYKPTLINKEKHIDTIKQIIFHLDKSFELSSNCGAIYDKGMLYRQIGEHDNALATFKTLIRNKEGHCSLVQLSNAYEQAGLCLNDMLSQSEEKGEEVGDMKTYFKKSIELSCSIVSKIPFLGDCWVSVPTFKEFLSGQAKTTEHLKDLFFLSKKFENYGESIKILKDLKELTADENERTKLDIQLVENYLSNGNYDDAVLALDTIVCLPNGYGLIDEKMYLRAHIEGGIVALKQESFEMARLRLRNALDFYRHTQHVHNIEGHENDSNTEDETFDVFILCNENLEEKCMSLVHILTAFELRVTINFQELLPGTSKMSGICRQFRHSKHFLLVIDEKQLKRIDEHYFEMMQEVVLNRNYGHILIIKTCKDAKVPSHLSKYPSMEMNVGADEVPENCFENEGLCQTIKALLIKLASSKQAA